MIGEVSLDGVFVPTLLMFACGAFMLTGLSLDFCPKSVSIDSLSTDP